MKLSLCALFVLPFVCFAQDEPVVETIYGRILGVVNTTEAGGNSNYAYSFIIFTRNVMPVSHCLY